MTDIVARTSEALTALLSRTLSPDEIALALHDAGLLAEPARTVPHRDEVAAAIAQGYEPENPTPNRHDYRATDAALALLADQPTVAEAKAQALKEFAAHIENTAQRDDVRLTEHAVNDAGGAYLAREQAQLIRDGK